MSKSKPSMGEIIHLNVGGKRFSTSRQTLTWNQDTFFTSLLSGRISSHQDDSGATIEQVDKALSRKRGIFIDRDPKLFSVILNFLRTKELQLRNVDIPALRHEAEFYGIRALVRRLALCEDLDHSSCGDALFHAYFQTPNPPLRDSASSCQSIVSVEGGESQNQRQNGRQGMGERSDAGQASSDRHPGHSRHSSFDSHHHGTHHINHLAPGGLDIIRASSSHRIEQGNYKCHDNNLRVTMVRGHQNWICAAFPHFVCCFRMKESTGWHLLWTSQHMDAVVERVALNAKVMGSNQENLNNKMVAASSGSLVWLWAVNDEGESRQIGVFNLHVLVDNLIFIGSQLVALSCTGKVGVWHSMTQHWQIQDVVPITSYDTAGSFLLLGCKDGSIYYIDMQKFPLRMKDNDLLVTELYTDPSHDMVTALSVYLTPKTSLSGNWIEIAYGTSSGTVRVIVQHPETVGHGPQLFQTFTVHRSPVTKVMLSEKHLVSVCSEYNHVRTWNVTRFRGMISTQPGSMPLASFKILSLDDIEPNISYWAGNDFGPFGEQDDQQLFFQKVVADTDQLFVRLSSTGQRVCVIRSVDGSNISAFCVHECEGSSRMGSCLRRYLFTGHANGSMQMWDLTTALDILNKQEEKGKVIKQGGPTSEELVRLLEHVDLSSSRCCTPGESPNASMMNLISQRNLSLSTSGPCEASSSSSDDVSEVLDTTWKSTDQNNGEASRPTSGVKGMGACSSQGDKVWL